VGKIGESLKAGDTIRFLPAFLISQKSEIFDSFPPGEAKGLHPLYYEKKKGKMKNGKKTVYF